MYYLVAFHHFEAYFVMFNSVLHILALSSSIHLHGESVIICVCECVCVAMFVVCLCVWFCVWACVVRECACVRVLGTIVRACM